MSDARIQDASRNRAEILVTGMTCSGCAGRVQRALVFEKGVSEASVDLPAGKATVAYDAATTTPAALLEAVRRTGYPAEIGQVTETEGGGI